MPTGYTADVQDGKVTEFKDFALKCAQAFNIRARDSSDIRHMWSLRPEPAPSYYVNSKANAQIELERLLNLTYAQIVEEYEKAVSEHQAATDKSERTRLTELDRYNRMLAKVELYVPPTDKHVEFKNFMKDQLKSSIDFDCKPWSWPFPWNNPIDWFLARVERERTNIERADQEIAKHYERDAERIAWVTELLTSLGFDPEDFND